MTWKLLLGWLALGAAALAGSPAIAMVMDIAPDGSITVYDGTPAYSTSTAHKLVTGAGLAPASNVAALISAAAQRYVLSPSLLRAVAWKESRFRSDEISPKGAVGVMQLMPATARALGVDQFDVSQNILGGAAYLRAMLDRYAGNNALALAAYNAGPLAVDRFGAVPPFPETQDYVRSILGEGLPPAAPMLSPMLVFNQ